MQLRSAAAGPALGELPSPPVEVEQQANDGFLINGSFNNAASSPFPELPAFGNNRRGHRSFV